MANSSAPIPSTFYAARQHFEQNSQIQAFSPSSSSAAKSHTVGPPPHLRAGAMDYKQYARPPQHPQHPQHSQLGRFPQPPQPPQPPQMPHQWGGIASARSGMPMCSSSSSTGKE